MLGSRIAASAHTALDLTIDRAKGDLEADASDVMRPAWRGTRE